MHTEQTITTDLLVIGGGINGTGVAVDASLRGLSVVLAESNDLAGATSSASSKLIHGGLRYLEQYDFKLVRSSLKEREILLNKAPHIIHPLRFVLPHNKKLRPVWQMRVGLFLYDLLAGKTQLAPSKKITLHNDHQKGLGLKDQFTIGFEYSDCRIDDARMVVFNAKQAESCGAKILLPFACVKLQREKNWWCAELISKDSQSITVYAKAVVNAAGPWAQQFMQQALGINKPSSMRSVKGSHFVIPKLYQGDHAYILQNADGRIVFALPYGFTAPHQNDFTLVGTTEVDYQDDLNAITMDQAERDYLCNVINQYFVRQIKPSDILWDYAGVRPLYDNAKVNNPSKIGREYHIEQEDYDGLPILSIFGGKITSFRMLSQQVVDRLKPYFKAIKASSTAAIPTTGGDIFSFSELFTNIQQRYPWLDKKHAYRLASSYGTKSFVFLQHANSYHDLGQCFGYNFYEIEAKYMVDHEWCYTLEAMIWRRSKLGLWLNKEEILAVKRWLVHYKAEKNLSFPT